MAPQHRSDESKNTVAAVAAVDRGVTGLHQLLPFRRDVREPAARRQARYRVRTVGICGAIPVGFDEVCRRGQAAGSALGLVQDVYGAGDPQQAVDVFAARSRCRRRC